MEPIEPKAPGIEKALEDLAQFGFGRSRKSSMETQTCVSCGKSAIEFKDELSAREYKISGLCQVCQDEFFCSEEE